MLTFIYLVAITAEAMSGALAAGRRSMDIFGVAVVAFVTALGGGTVRDLILDRPVFWVERPLFVLIAAGAAVVVWSFPHTRGGEPELTRATAEYDEFSPHAWG